MNEEINVIWTYEFLVDKLYLGGKSVLIGALLIAAKALERKILNILVSLEQWIQIKIQKSSI